ncbi:hypothetical protein PAXRUDRAFT_63899, partial [Paxillus rubicundulus Ve08.2h10]
TRTFLIPPAHFQLHPPSLPIFGPTRALLVPPVCFQPHAHPRAYIFSHTRPARLFSNPIMCFQLHLYISNPPPLLLQRCTHVFSPHPPCPPVFDPLSVSSPAHL